MLELRSDWAQIGHVVPQSELECAPLQVAASLTAAMLREATGRDPVTLTRDLLRLERHYRGEAERLQAEAADARKAARECRQWRRNMQAAK